MAETKKQYTNKVEIIGELKSLEVKDTKTKAGVPMKIATLQVTTGEGETHRVQTMAVEYYEKDGVKTDNKQYKAIQTMENEYHTLQDVVDGKAEKATVVRVNGNLELNMYKGQNGYVEQPQVSARFVNRVDDAMSADFKAEFLLTGAILTQGQRVVINEEDTDQVKVKIALIDYRGQAHPIEFTAETYDEIPFPEYFEDDAEIGSTVTIEGKIINRYIIKEIPRETGGRTLGKQIVDTKRESERKLLVTSLAEVEEDTSEFIEANDLKDAMAKYEAKRVEVQSTETKKEEKKAGITRKASTTVQPSVVDADELPF